MIEARGHEADDRHIRMADRRARASDPSIMTPNALSFFCPTYAEVVRNMGTVTRIPNGYSDSLSAVASGACALHHATR